MAIELHHLHPGHDDDLSRLKARIAELEKENAELKEQYRDMDVTHTVHIAKMNALIEELEESQRWRKFSEEKPPTDGSYMCAYKNKNKDDGVLFVDEAVWDGEKWSSKFDFWEDIIYWQFKPKAPEGK